MHWLSSAVFTCHEELWKRPSMKHSVSLERPQIVEDFIQRLMKGVERDTDGQVNISSYTFKNKGPKRDSTTFQWTVLTFFCFRSVKNILIL